MQVSIIIPCHNVQEYLPKALGSALGQQYPVSEIICVDDGSTDGTAAVIAEHKARHPDRIRLIEQANHGASAARNRGMEAATGTYLQFLDADDSLLPDKIGAQVAIAQAEGLPDLVVGDFEQVMPNGLLLPALALYGQPWMALIRTRMGTTSANLWKREAVVSAGGWDEDMASSQDYELIFRLLKRNASVAWDPHVRTSVLKRASGSISRTGMRANWDRYIALRQAMLEHLQATDPAGRAAEIDVLRQYIFMALRIVAAEDLPAAIANYRRSMGRGFRPQVSKAITERYAAIHNLLGFPLTERLMRLVKGRRPHTA